MNRKTKLVTAVLAGVVILMAVSNASANLLINGSFEEPSPTGWEGGFATYNHTTSVYYEGPAPADCGNIYGWAWGGGTMNSATQTVDMTGKGNVPYVFSAWLASWTADPDFARASIEFFDGADGTGNSLAFVEFNGNDGEAPHIVGSATEEGLADPSVAWTQDNWTLYETVGIVPAGTISAFEF